MTLWLSARVAEEAVATADPAFGFGIGGALFLLSVTVAGSALTLRSRTHARLRRQVDLAYSGLTVVAVEKLTVLQAELNLMLPSASEAFDPGEFLVDPSRVEIPASHGIGALKQRAHVVKDFERLLKVCSSARILSSTFLILVLISTGLYFLAFNLQPLWQLFAAATVLTAVVGGGLTVAYSVLNTRLQRAIEAADPLEHRGGQP